MLLKNVLLSAQQTSREGLTSSPTCLPGQGGCLIAMWSNLTTNQEKPS